MRWNYTTGVVLIIVDILLLFFDKISMDYFGIFLALILAYLTYGFVTSPWEGDELEEDKKPKEKCKVLYRENGGTLKFCRKN